MASAGMNPSSTDDCYHCRLVLLEKFGSKSRAWRDPISPSPPSPRHRPRRFVRRFRLVQRTRSAKFNENSSSSGGPHGSVGLAEQPRPSSSIASSAPRWEVAGLLSPVRALATAHTATFPRRRCKNHRPPPRCPIHAPARPSIRCSPHNTWISQIPDGARR